MHTSIHLQCWLPDDSLDGQEFGRIVNMGTSPGLHRFQTQPKSEILAPSRETSMIFNQALSRRHFLKLAGAAGWVTTTGAMNPRRGCAADAAGLSIIVPPKAGAPLLFAARELQKYADRMGQVRCQIVDDSADVAGPRVLLTSAASPGERALTIVSAENLPAADTDGYFLRGNGDSLLIAGGRDRAVMFGVYDLLERLGCRWFGPLEEQVPKLSEFSLPTIKASAEPAMTWRGLELIAGSDPAVVDWMAKARLNVAWPEKYTPNKDLTVAAANLKAAAIPEMIERGLTIFWGGHILPILFSPEKYSDHPEYFAQIRGKRLDPTLADVQARWQLCTSNPDVIRILIDSTITFLKNHPWIEVLFLWANDTTAWCECAECRNLEPQPDKPATFGGLNRSASYCRLVKLVNEGVQSVLPGRRLAFNHYYNLEDVPDDLALLPGQSALSAVDVYRQCSRHPLADPNCPGGKRIEPLARAWGPHYKDTITWTYYWAWNFMKGLPFARTNKIAADLKFLHSLGIRGNVDNVTLTPANMELYDDRPGLFLTEQWRYNLLDFHIYARACWNPDLNVKETVADFIERYYGPAARPMARFWERLEAMTVRFGADPNNAPEDRQLAGPVEIHGWLKNIRGLIPNRQNWEELEADLREARHRAATAYKEPFKARYMPYVERVQLLERALAVWESTTTETTYPRN